MYVVDATCSTPVFKAFSEVFWTAINVLTLLQSTLLLQDKNDVSLDYDDLAITVSGVLC